MRARRARHIQRNVGVTRRKLQTFCDQRVRLRAAQVHFSVAHVNRTTEAQALSPDGSNTGVQASGQHSIQGRLVGEIQGQINTVKTCGCQISGARKCGDLG